MHMQVVRPIRQQHTQALRANSTWVQLQYAEQKYVRIIKYFLKVTRSFLLGLGSKRSTACTQVYQWKKSSRTCWDELIWQQCQKVARFECKAQSTELTRVPPELVQHFRL
jgi:hypothetical protein